MELHLETITPEMRELILEFGKSEISSRFYLTGGTALALQFGHRKSFDLDFFSPTADIPAIRNVLAASLDPFFPVLSDSSWGNIVFLASGVRIGFFGYGFQLVSPTIEMEGIRIAGIEDIGLMKLGAILDRASRKDFYDLYFICQVYPLERLFELARVKYPSIRDFEIQAAKRLAYFEMADQETDPILFAPVNWPQVKSFYKEQVISLGKGWIE